MMIFVDAINAQFKEYKSTSLQEYKFNREIYYQNQLWDTLDKIKQN